MSHIFRKQTSGLVARLSAAQNLLRSQHSREHPADAELRQAMENSLVDFAPLPSQWITQQLNKLGLVEASVPKNGHCFFSAFGFCLEDAPPDAANLLRFAYVNILVCTVLNCKHRKYSQYYIFCCHSKTTECFHCPVIICSASVAD